MQSKSDTIRDHLAAGDQLGALRIASRFFDRGADTDVFKRGWGAHQNPSFYRQIGRDPEALVTAALQRLAAKFRLP